VHHPRGVDVVEPAGADDQLLAAAVPAHAAGAPWLGRNALDGVVTAYQGVAQLRQHILPTDRIHGIITDGGAAPNVVPERAAALFYVRSAATFVCSGT
jgi:metal-dependent amidase/aminoacylase/carboxypeptidase family protein